MAGNLKLNIITPEKEFYNGEIIELNTENDFGKLGILANHMPMITTLKPAVTTFKDAKGKTFTAFTSTGVLRVMENQVKILCEACEWPEDIDIKRAEEAKKRAEERLNKKSSVDTQRAEIALQRALLRLKIKG